MRIALHEAGKGHALPPMSLEFGTGMVRYALAETEQRPTVLGLIASGRMRPATGSVTIDGASNARMLRTSLALVDAPEVSDPHADIALAGVVAEELMFAGRRATPLHARRWLKELGYDDLASTAIGTIDPTARVRILCELAVLREGTKGIVLVSPDRHGGSPDGWWRVAEEFADRGFAMLVIIGGSAAIALEHELGALNASGPIAPLVLTEAVEAAEAADLPSTGSGNDEAHSGDDAPSEPAEAEPAEPAEAPPVEPAEPVEAEEFPSTGSGNEADSGNEEASSEAEEAPTTNDSPEEAR